MLEDNYKLKYIKYKKKYFELKKIQKNKNNIINKIIILPNEYAMLDYDKKNEFDIYEIDKLSNPISYIKKNYLKSINIGGVSDDDIDIDVDIDIDININTNDNCNYDELETTSNKEIDNILEKKIITPYEYYLLSDTNKSRYEINESDYDKFPNRVVPKNYIKIDE